MLNKCKSLNIFLSCILVFIGLYIIQKIKFENMLNGFERKYPQIKKFDDSLSEVFEKQPKNYINNSQILEKVSEIYKSTISTKILSKHERWLNFVEKRFKIRKDSLTKRCNLIKSELDYSIEYDRNQIILSNKDYRLAICIIAKVTEFL